MHDIRVNDVRIVERFQVQKEASIQEHLTMLLADEALHRSNVTRLYACNYIDTRLIIPTPKKLESIVFNVPSHIHR